MAKEQSKPQEKQTESKLVWKITPAEIPKHSRILGRIVECDAIIQAIVARKEKSFKINITNSDFRRLWSPLTSRIKEFNAKADREFNLSLHTANRETFIVKSEKK